MELQKYSKSQRFWYENKPHKNSIRHSITKILQLHFVAAEEYRKRDIQLGENPIS